MKIQHIYDGSKELEDLSNDKVVLTLTTVEYHQLRDALLRGNLNDRMRLLKWIDEAKELKPKWKNM